MIIMGVTGGRKYRDANRVAEVLSGMMSRHPGFAVVQGGAPGADTLALDWCLRNGVPCFTAHACWDFYGNRAGGIRNRWMHTYFELDFLAAFPGGVGTADMVRRATAAGIPVYFA